MPPLVSIAIPTFERFDYLREAVASALTQTYEHIEVLIGDDGPTEKIRAWGQAVAGQDARVHYKRNQRNLGLAGNWNALADAARGEYLVIIGDDDRLLPDFVKKMVEIIQPGAQVAFANHYLIDSQGVRLESESLQLTRRYHRDELIGSEGINAAACVWRNSIPMSAALVRTAAIQRLRFKEDLNSPEIEFFARLAQEGGHFVFNPEYLAEYRTHQQSSTTLGLWSEKLVNYLSLIEVAAEVEPYKRQFMGDLLVNVVSRCLQQGNRNQARQFLRHEYYPRARRKHVETTAVLQAHSLSAQDLQSRKLNIALTSWAQELCASVPAFVGCRAYRVLQRTKAAIHGANATIGD